MGFRFLVYTVYFIYEFSVYLHMLDMCKKKKRSTIQTAKLSTEQILKINDICECLDPKRLA